MGISMRSNRTAVRFAVALAGVLASAGTPGLRASGISSGRRAEMSLYCMNEGTVVLK